MMHGQRNKKKSIFHVVPKLVLQDIPQLSHNLLLTCCVTTNRKNFTCTLSLECWIKIDFALRIISRSSQCWCMPSAGDTCSSVWWSVPLSDNRVKFSFFKAQWLLWVPLALIIKRTVRLTNRIYRVFSIILARINRQWRDLTLSAQYSYRDHSARFVPHDLSFVGLHRTKFALCLRFLPRRLHAVAQLVEPLRYKP